MQLPLSHSLSISLRVLVLGREAKKGDAIYKYTNTTFFFIQASIIRPRIFLCLNTFEATHFVLYELVIFVYIYIYIYLDFI